MEKNTWYGEEFDRVYTSGNSKVYIQFNRNPIENNNAIVLKENKRVQLMIAKSLIENEEKTSSAV